MVASYLYYIYVLISNIIVRIYIRFILFIDFIQLFLDILFYSLGGFV